MNNILLVICGTLFIIGQFAAMVMDAPGFDKMDTFCSKLGPVIGRVVYMLPMIVGIAFIVAPLIKRWLK